MARKSVQGIYREDMFNWGRESYLLHLLLAWPLGSLPFPARFFCTTKGLLLKPRISLYTSSAPNMVLVIPHLIPDVNPLSFPRSVLTGRPVPRFELRPTPFRAWHHGAAGGVLLMVYRASVSRVVITLACSWTAYVEAYSHSRLRLFLLLPRPFSSGLPSYSAEVGSRSGNFEVLGTQPASMARDCGWCWPLFAAA